MEIGKAIYKLLKDSTDVGAICADRIYPEMAQQDVDVPFIVYTVTDTTPSATKNATSKLDTGRVELYVISDDYEQAMNLGIAVRTALDRQSGTISAVEVQSIDFDTSDVQYDPDQRVYVLEQTYDVRIQRTGTAQVVSQFPGNTFTVQEVDGDPSGAVNKLVFSNGTVTIAGNTATIASGGGSLTVQETSAANSNTADTLEFPTDSVTHASGKATISFLQGLVSEYGFDALLTDTYFPNGLYGDINQDGVVGTSDFLALLGNFGATTSPTADDVARAFDLAESQISSGNSSFFSNAQYSKAASTKSSLETAGHVVEYFQGVNTALGGGYVQDWDDDTVSGNTVRRTLYISSTSFPTSLSQFQVYPLGPYDDTAKATVQAVVDAFVSGSTGNFSIVVIRTLISATPDKLLDTYTGSAFAVSVRLLDKDYTGYCMKVRRASDDAEANIGFDSNGDLDTAAIATHCGSSAGYVSVWYDMSGNSNNATQSTTSLQPQIYNGTAVITDNGKPAVSYAGSNRLDAIFTAKTISAQSSFAVTSISSSGGFDRILTQANGSVSDVPFFIAILRDGTSTTVASYLSGYGSTHTFSYDTQFQFSSIHNGTTLINYFNGTSGTSYSQTLSKTIDRYCMGARPDGPNGLTGKIQEIIIYESDQSSNRTGIESDITGYF
jgi:hypothetical protein